MRSSAFLDEGVILPKLGDEAGCCQSNGTVSYVFTVDQLRGLMLFVCYGSLGCV